MSEAATGQVPAFRGVVEEVFEALGDCFRAERLTVGTLGLALSFVAAAVFGVTAAILLLRNSLGPAALFAVVAGFVLYAGLLITFGAISRIAMADRVGQATSATSALSFALWRSHTLVGIPLFTLLVALAVGFAGAWLGSKIVGQQGIGIVLGPIALIAVFVLNLILICAVLVSHCLTGPCVACINQSFVAVGSRLVQVFQERLHNFVGYQAAVLSVWLSLTALTGLIFVGAFVPAFHWLAAGGTEQQVSREAPAPGRRIEPEDIWGQETQGTGATEEEADGWIEKLREWLQRDGRTNQAPLLGAAAILALLLGVCPLAFAAGAESAVYLGLTGDTPAEDSQARAPTAGVAEAPRPKHPPITHCWRCDAINRYQAGTCSKCGAQLAVCPHCFSTNDPSRAECASCGERLLPEEGVEEVEEVAGAEAE